MLLCHRAMRQTCVLFGVSLIWTLVFGIPAQAQTLASHQDNLAERARFDDDVRIPPDAPLNALTAEAAATGDNRIDALLSGYKWSGVTTITYSFYKDSAFGGQYYGSETGVREVSEGIKQNVRAILAMYGTLLNLQFVEVQETPANVGLIRVMLSSAPSYAYAYYPSSASMFNVGGDVHLNAAYDRQGDTNGFQNPAGEHGYVALIHELGHALGLKHPFDNTPNLPADQDNHTNTVMSYNFYGESPGTPMAFDLMALGYLYGSRTQRTTDDTYVFTRANVDQYSLNGQLFITPSYDTKETLFDSSGVNVLDFSSISGSPSGYRIDTKPMGWITTNANFQSTWYYAGTTLGPGVRIQKVINSVSDDTIYANADANVFAGYGPGRQTGNDVIADADSSDRIDLSGYAPSQVTQAVSGNDLVLKLSTYGSITIRNYYAGNRPDIVYTASAPRLTISDVSVQEGNSGSTAAVFTVMLAPPAASAVSVNWVTSNGTATSGTDYVAGSGNLTFAPGETQKTIAVPVLGDTTVEGNETFSVLLSAPSAGTEIADAQGDATIVNDDQFGSLTNNAPVAVLTATPTTGTAPLTVNLSSAGSFDDGAITFYGWSTGDGWTFAAQNITHTYTTPGIYTVQLSLWDNSYHLTLKTVTVTVLSAAASNNPPVPAVTATPSSGTAPLPVSFSSAGSSDSDGGIVSYAWAFGDGSSAAGVSAGHTYTSAGTFTATLTVTDNKGAAASKSVTIVVTPQSSSSTSMFVSGISMEVVPFLSAWFGKAYTMVVDGTGRPVANTIVVGRWFGLTSSSYVYAMTDATGRATFMSTYVFQGGTFGFTIADLLKSGMTYDPARNVESTDTIGFFLPSNSGTN